MRWRAARAKVLDHIGADGLIAGMVERGLGALGVGAGLFPNRLEAGDALFQAGGVEIGDAGLDGVEEPVEALVGLGDPLVQFGQVLAAALGALLAAVEDAGEDGFQPLGSKQAVFQVARDQLSSRSIGIERPSQPVLPCRALVEQV